MATGEGERECSMEGISTCAVCLEHYREHHLLRCLHAACKPCILQSFVTADVDDRKILCPVCRSQSSETLSEQEVKGLPKNVINTGDANSEMDHCAACEDSSCVNSVSVWCERCKVGLCGKHIGPHVLAFADEKHILRTLDVSQQKPNEAKESLVKSSHLRLVPSAPQREAPLCSRHSQPLRMYCGSCDVPICGDCIPFDHHGHTPVSSANDVVEKRLSKVEEQVSELQQNTTERLERALRSVDDVCSVMERRAEELSADILDAGEKTVQTVQMHVAQMLQEVEAVKNARLKVLGQQGDELRSHLKAVQNVIHFSRKMMGVKEWGQAFFALLQALEGRMVDLISADIKEQPQHHARLSFQTADDSIRSAKAKEGVGKVVTREASAEHSVIGGETNITTWKGHVATFKLEAKDRDGEAMDIGGDIVTVRNEASPKSLAKVTVEDHDNGLYTISCKADYFGAYQFAVSVNGVELANRLMVVIEDFQWDTVIPEREGYIEVRKEKHRASFKKSTSPSNYYNVLGHMPLVSGEYTWRVKIGSSSSSHCLGVAPKHGQVFGCYAYSDVAYCWRSDGSVYYRDNISYDDGLSSWLGSDTFQLCLNCSHHTLQITNLRTDETSTMSNLPDKEYYPFAAIYQSGNSVEFCL